jgi:hypothetical protein
VVRWLNPCVDGCVWKERSDGWSEKVSSRVAGEGGADVPQGGAEAGDPAGGRADILVTFNSASFNVECKIEDDDASENGLRKYVAQASEYQNTGPGFAILLALDKTVGAEGAVNLFDSIWIEHVQRHGEREPRLVVIIRIPGGRENPNQLRPAPRRSPVVSARRTRAL